MTSPRDEVSVFTSGTSAVTSTLSLTAPTCRRTSRRAVCSTCSSRLLSRNCLKPGLSMTTSYTPGVRLETVYSPSACDWAVRNWFVLTLRTWMVAAGTPAWEASVILPTSVAVDVWAAAMPSKTRRAAENRAAERTRIVTSYLADPGTCYNQRALTVSPGWGLLQVNLPSSMRAFRTAY